MSILRLCLFGFFCLCISLQARAEIISASKPQSGSPIENTATYRSIYLGSLFANQTISNPVQGILAYGSIANAPSPSPQLFLYAGKASSANPGSFVNATTTINTGLAFFTTASGGIQAQVRSNDSLNLSLGTSLKSLLDANKDAGGVDFWFVSNGAGSFFDAPAGSTSPQTNYFGVQLTAVPEPSSIGLVLGAATVGGIYRRWRKKQNAVLN